MSRCIPISWLNSHNWSTYGLVFLKLKSSLFTVEPCLSGSKLISAIQLTWKQKYSCIVVWIWKRMRSQKVSKGCRSLSHSEFRYCKCSQIGCVELEILGIGIREGYQIGETAVFHVLLGSSISHTQSIVVAKNIRVQIKCMWKAIGTPSLNYIIPN